MPKKEKVKKEEKISIPKSTAELLPFVCIDKGLFYMSDKSYADIMQPASRRCRNTFSEVLAIWKNSLPNTQSGAQDLRPTDTKRQQQYFQHKINTAENPFYREILQTKYDELVDVNLYYTDREYYLMIFCPSYEKYLEARNIITVTLKNVGLISDISVDKKIMILTKLCNKATSVYG